MGYDIWILLLGAAAGIACGFLNTAASSGSAVSLPILMLIGLDPISANATNRIPVLIGALSATLSFHKKKALPWKLAARVCLPVTIGGIFGVILAEIMPARNLGLVITAAVLIALVLLFTKLKAAIEQSISLDPPRYGAREFLIFLGIGAWLGFIVLDGATYLLLALTMAVGLNLTHANAVKTAALVPVTMVAMLMFAYNGNVDWKIGAFMGAGSVVGGLLGARLATSPSARKWVYMLLVIVISGELLHLAMHYVFQTH
ncbi:sulfite exporter TauE/SafE family protein [soil metagenome]